MTKKNSSLINFKPHKTDQKLQKMPSKHKDKDKNREVDEVDREKSKSRRSRSKEKRHRYVYTFYIVESSLTHVEKKTFYLNIFYWKNIKIQIKFSLIGLAVEIEIVETETEREIGTGNGDVQSLEIVKNALVHATGNVVPDQGNIEGDPGEFGIDQKNLSVFNTVCHRSRDRHRRSRSRDSRRRSSDRNRSEVERPKIPIPDATMLLQHSQQLMAQQALALQQQLQQQNQPQALLQTPLLTAASALTASSLLKQDFLIDAFSNANQSMASSRNFTNLLDNIPGEVRPTHNAENSQNTNSCKCVR